MLKSTCCPTSTDVLIPARLLHNHTFEEQRWHLPDQHIKVVFKNWITVHNAQKDLQVPSLALHSCVLSLAVPKHLYCHYQTAGILLREAHSSPHQLLNPNRELMLPDVIPSDVICRNYEHLSNILLHDWHIFIDAVMGTPSSKAVTCLPFGTISILPIDMLLFVTAFSCFMSQEVTAGRMTDLLYCNNRLHGLCFISLTKT